MKTIGLDTLSEGHMAASVIDAATWKIVRCRVPRTPAAVQVLVERFRPLQCACNLIEHMRWLVELFQANEVLVQTDALRKRRLYEVTDDDSLSTIMMVFSSRRIRWRHADELARRAALGVLYTMPTPVQRPPAWPPLIRMRQELRFEHARICSQIRGILRQERMPAHYLSGNALSMTMMRLLGKPLGTCEGLEIWRGILHLLLQRLMENEAHMGRLTAAFNHQAEVVAPEPDRMAARPLPVLMEVEMA